MNQPQPLPKPADVTLRNARVLPGGYRNFSGKPDQYTREGDRSFNVELPRDIAEAMREDGFNVKSSDPRDEGGEPMFFLKVAVSYRIKSPQIWMISGSTRSLMSEDLVGILDEADLVKVDLVLEASPWSVNGSQGIKAYLKKGFFTINQDELDAEYENVPVSNG